jgi:hypothetical protein
MPALIYEGISYQQSTHAIYCKLCQTEAHSRTRHDYKTCVCGKAGVDGGIALGNRYIGNLENIEVRSRFFAMVDGKKVWLSQEAINQFFQRPSYMMPRQDF